MKKRNIKGLFRGIAMLLVLSMFFTSAPVAQADEDTTTTATPAPDTKYDKYIAFGANLSASEKQAVLDGFGISSSDLSSYKTISITNQEEHDYLESYIASNVIGSRALSSVMVVKTEDGSGVKVSTKHITYCSSGMYCNALITAGLKNAQVTVVGPFDISGTSALVGAMKAYAAMTDTEISQSTMDAATNELVTTAEVADSVGDKEKVEQLVAATKEKVFSDGLTSEADIRDAVESSAKALNVDLSDDDVAAITNMMEKVSKEDVDVNDIKEQAKDIYEKLKDKGIDFSKVDTSGLADKVGNFFSNIFEAVKNFFTNLFS